MEEMIEEISERLDLKGNPNGTLNKVEVNDKIPKDALKVAIDQLVMLSKSELWSYVANFFYDTMELYWKLPAEKQVKVLPNKVKYITALGKELKQMSENQKWRTPSKAMNINDDSEEDKDNKTAHKYDIDLKEVNNDDFVIIETEEETKDILEELDIDLSDFDFIIHNNDEDVKESFVEEVQLQEYEEAVIEGTPITPRQQFMLLKRKFKKDQTIRQLEFESKKGTIAHILYNINDWQRLKHKYKLDSTINYNATSHYCKLGDFTFYIIRTR